VPGPPQPIFPPPPVIPSAGSGLPAYTLPPTSGARPPVNAPDAQQSPPRASQSAPPAAAQASGAPTDWFPSSAPPAPSARPVSSPPQGGSPGPFGVGASAGSRQPFGGPAAQVSTPPARPGTYGSEPASTVPQQRGHGTVYGGAAPEQAPHGNVAAESPIDMTMPVNMNVLENSGSLTGHILAQGWDHGSDDNRRSNVKVGIAMLVVLLVLVGVSLVFLLTAGSAFSNMIHGVFK
jgi:hypothetical protein